MCSVDCADAVCEVLNNSGLYEARMIGPDSYPRLPFTAENIQDADCLVMPGGLGDSDQFDYELIDDRKMVCDYVAKGGKYLGICQGAYFAGHHYFNILTDLKAVQYIKRRKSCVKRLDHDVVNIVWEDVGEVPMYFHDGAAFIPTKKEIKANVIGRYLNSDIAAMIQKYRKGRVGVIGPHPEAMKWWFYSQTRIRHRWKDSIQHKLLLDFIKKLLS
jgi:glutamine amidotransferase-like uncharacterized protein